ncbi:MAG: hypothetical protein Athens101410_173 [Parcubacteria group bacterium Athens1014_10]|nr:MAG: hypothetical protein Athens101410_173 [Parcubacteria group bacterium Athens1014_10]TSD05537.1 MAG: hypothetical protein Athens071412_238 [Parcubacteria group bacterium Athens0714_12]
MSAFPILMKIAGQFTVIKVKIFKNRHKFLKFKKLGNVNLFILPGLF